MTKKSTNYRITDPLLEPYFIQYDSNCFTVLKNETSNDSGKEREQTVGYYSSLKACLDCIAKDAIRTQDYTSIQEYIDAYRNQLNTINKITIQVNENIESSL